MESTNLIKSVETGALIDVSHVAQSIGLFNPTYVTSAFWNSVEISSREDRLAGVLDASAPIHHYIEFGKFGVQRFLVDGGSTCRWGVAATALVEEFDGYGIVVVLGEFDEELDFRIPRSPEGGSFFTM